MATTCRWCRTEYTRRRIDQAYCSSECSREADKLELKRARAVYRALYHWRNDRSKSKAALVRLCLRFICREVRDWIDQDRAEQRLPPPRPSEWVPRGHERRKAVCLRSGSRKAVPNVGRLRVAAGGEEDPERPDKVGVH